MNHFPELEEARRAALARGASSTRDDVYRGLVRYLARQHGIEVRVERVGDERGAMRRYDPRAQADPALRGAAAAAAATSSSRTSSACSRSPSVLDRIAARSRS